MSIFFSETRRFGLLSAFVGLAACGANTEADFLCEAQVGTPCATIASVDGTGASGLKAVAEHPSDTAAKSLSQGTIVVGKKNLMFSDGGHPYNAANYRRPEVVGTLWIAPLLDEAGVLHESRFVQFVIQEADWRG